jgi:hypothetical protein
LLDNKHGWNENAFWDVINKKWCKFVSPFLFNNTYGLPALTKDTKFQFKYIIFDWLLYRLFVLNRSWKSDSLQIMTFVHICSTWSIDELKTRFETWITWNDVNGNWFTYLIYLCSHCERNDQIKYFMFDWSIYGLFALNRCSKLESFQIMIFVNLCWTWDIVELKTSFETWRTCNDINGLSLANFII